MNTERTVQIQGPDQGWAWVVCAASCVANVIVNGQGRMVGILYRAFIVSFGVDRRTASVPFGVRTSTRNLLGPLAGILGQKYGIQRIILIGGVTSALGTACCFVAADIAWITILWGAIGSIGSALCMVQIQVVVGQYFKKNKTTAQGIAFSGACVGSFLFPVAVQWMLKNYGIPGVFLIIAGMVLHTVPVAMICKKPPWLESRSTQVFPNTLTEKLDVLFFRDNESQIVKLLASGAVIPDEPASIKLEESHITEALKSMYACTEYYQPTSKKSRRCGIFNKKPEKSTCVLNSYINSNFLHGDFTNSNLDSNTFNAEADDALRLCVLSRMKRFLDMHPDQVLTVCPHENAAKIKHELQKLYNENEILQNGCLMEKSATGERPLNTFWHHIKTTKRLTQNPFFMLICLCRIVHFMTFMPMMTTVVDFTIDRGFPEDEGSVVIAVLSVGDMMGRLFFGWVTDKGIMSLHRYMMTMMILQGANIAAIPFMPNSVTIYTFLCIFGILQGTIFVHHPTLVQKYVKSHAHSIAMGCMDFFPGLMGLGMPLYIGFFRDKMEAYDYMFFINGVFTALVGTLWAMEPHLQRRYSSQEPKRVTT